MGRLDELDLTAKLSTKEYEDRLVAGQRRIDPYVETVTTDAPSLENSALASQS